MKERPILFSGPMVRAILDGKKTVTRRVVKGNQIPKEDFDESYPNLRWTAVGQKDPRWGYIVSGSTEAECAHELAKHGICPYGQPGDRLWVRESWWQAGDWQATYPEDDTGAWFGSKRVVYSADGTPPNEPNASYPDGLRNGAYSAAAPNKIWRHRPSIHMPRWACRILLDITGVRVERLHDITTEQIIAEGISTSMREHDAEVDLRRQWRELWESTGGDWEANPWVWVVEFQPVARPDRAV